MTAKALAYTTNH